MRRRTRTVRWLLRLYPRAWRRRYELEVTALLEQHAVTWRTGIDLALGALAARSDPYFTAPPGMTVESWRLRRAHRTILVTFPLLVLGHCVFLDELDDVCRTWTRSHPDLERLKAIADLLTYTGGAAFVLTALALAGLGMTQFLKPATRRSRRLLWGGVGIAVALVGVGSAVPAVRLVLVIGSAILVPWSMAGAIHRSEISSKTLGWILAADALPVVGMAAQALFLAVWGRAIWTAVAVPIMRPMVDRSYWPAGEWRLELAGGIAWMVLMAGAAIGGWVRGMTGYEEKCVD